MLRGELQGGAVRPAEHDRHAELPARHVQHLGGRVDDLVEREQREIPGHELDHRSQARHRGPHADPAKPSSAIGVSRCASARIPPAGRSYLVRS
jgi:hypothetical protein